MAAVAAELTRNYSSSCGRKVEFHKNIMDGEEKTYGGCEGPDICQTDIFRWSLIYCKERTCANIKNNKNHVEWPRSVC